MFVLISRKSQIYEGQEKEGKFVMINIYSDIVIMFVVYYTFVEEKKYASMVEVVLPIFNEHFMIKIII